MRRLHCGASWVMSHRFVCERKKGGREGDGGSEGVWMSGWVMSHRCVCGEGGRERERGDGGSEGVWVSG